MQLFAPLLQRKQCTKYTNKIVPCTFDLCIQVFLFPPYALHQKADYFFVPPLNLLAEKLRLSPSIAGITLLAIGNGEANYAMFLCDRYLSV